MKRTLLIICLISTSLFFSGFVTQKTSQEKRIEILKMRNETLALLHNNNEAQMLLNRAYGYAVFSNVGVNVILFSAEGGSGVAHNNLNGKNTYMQMVSAGVGFGLGIKDFRAIFIFETKSAFDNFVEYGWEANAQADVALQAEDKGASLSQAITVAPNTKLYKITKNGVALQATIQGTKYFKVSSLNEE